MAGKLLGNEASFILWNKYTTTSGPNLTKDLKTATPHLLSTHSFVCLHSSMTQEIPSLSLIQLIPLIDAALAIAKDEQLMSILNRIAHDPEPIDRSSCSEKEREVLDALSCGTKRDDEDVSVALLFKVADFLTFHFSAISYQTDFLFVQNFRISTTVIQ